MVKKINLPNHLKTLRIAYFHQLAIKKMVLYSYLDFGFAFHLDFPI